MLERLLLRPGGWRPLCLLSELSSDRKQFIFAAFDPLQGRGGEVTRINGGGFLIPWDLAPDGSRSATIITGDNRVRVLSLTGGPRELTARGLSLYSVNRSADGKGFYIQSSELLIGWRGTALQWIWKAT